MYSPAIIATEQAFQPLPSGKDRFNLVLPLQSFSRGILPLLRYRHALTLVS